MPTYRARVVTPESPDRVRSYEDAVVEVSVEGRIVDIRGGGPADEDLRPHVLLPGFVDAHLHFPQTAIVGSASGPLLEWLEKSTFPEEARFADLSYAARIAEVFCHRLASAGTTLSMVYGSVHPAAVARLFDALDAAGLRSIAGPVLMDAHSPSDLLLPVNEAIPALEGLVDRYDGHDDRLFVGVAPRFALSCTAEMLRAAGELSRRRKLWVTTHLSENLQECAVAKDLYGTDDYLQVYEDAGLMSNKAVFAHCVHLSDDEWDRFDAAGSVVAHCPDSNFFLGSGTMPIGAVMDRSIPLALGTDVAGGRSFRIPKICSSAHDNALMNGVRVAPETLLWWATRGGALALGHGNIGAIEVGLEADMTLFSVPEWVETTDQILASVLFDGDSPGPSRTWVRGRQVWPKE